MFWSHETCINDGSGWSLWSKDIIVLITADSRAGPQAWVDAYHDEHPYPSVESLPIKSGALQGVVVVENALNHQFESLHIVYDGINGQLPNLDLFNTVVAIASGQMGIGVSLQRMWNHKDSYRERLQTMLRGMVSQGLGHTSGPHSSFIPYHIDAITLKAVGDGWQDEMAMGRCIESIFRSLNNLLEHFHQSFFFYLLMQSNRFVSIGTYLPSAMLVAVNFTIMAIALWVQSGRSATPKVAAPIPSSEKDGTKKPEMEVVMANDGMVAIAPKPDIALERQLFLPITLVVAMHFIGVIPLYLFNHTTSSVISLSLHPHQTQIMIRKLIPPIFPQPPDPPPYTPSLHPNQPPPPLPTRTSNLPLHLPLPPPPPFGEMHLPPPPRHVPRHPLGSQLLSRPPRRPLLHSAILPWHPAHGRPFSVFYSVCYLLLLLLLIRDRNEVEQSPGERLATFVIPACCCFCGL